MSELAVAIATLALVGLLVLGLCIYLLSERTKHLSRIVVTLVKERERATGSRLDLDPSLLGEPVDVVAPEDEDLYSRIPPRTPWIVLTDEERPPR